VDLFTDGHNNQWRIITRRDGSCEWRLVVATEQWEDGPAHTQETAMARLSESERVDGEDFARSLLEEWPDAQWAA
jgi:hypothetical protein